MSGYGKKRASAYRASRDDLKKKIYDESKDSRTSEDEKWREQLKNEVDNLEDFIMFGWSSRHQGIYLSVNSKRLPDNVTAAQIVGSVPFAILLKHGLQDVLPILFNDDKKVEKNIEKMFDLWAELLVNAQVVYAEKIYDAINRAVDDQDAWNKKWADKWEDAIHRATIKMVDNMADESGHLSSVAVVQNRRKNSKKTNKFLRKIENAATAKDERLSWENFLRKKKTENNDK